MSKGKAKLLKRKIIQIKKEEGMEIEEEMRGRRREG